MLRIFRPKSLQQRLLFFLFLPVAVLMFGIGAAGFIYARITILHEWSEAAILKLERAAHFVDMDLHRTKELLQMYHDAAEAPFSNEVREWIITQLRRMKGVARVNLTLVNEDAVHTVGNAKGAGEHGDHGGAISSHGEHKYPFHIELTTPQYDSILDHETVSLTSELKDEKDRVIGKLEVVLRFDYLIANIVASSWWQTHKAFLVDASGRVLTCTIGNRHSIGCENDPLELATLEALKEKPFGTILGEGYPPGEVSGFYRLSEAPWSLVVIAPGKEILAPVIRFRTYYFVVGTVSSLLILLLIRLGTTSTVSSIKDVSMAADRVARGSYSEILPINSRDEVGQLIRSFNAMVLQLEERMRLKEAMDLAVEVQQSLLPCCSPVVNGLEIAGKSIYCDETGGDYYDFIQFPEMGANRIGIAVGDVVGHGIAAALLMTTVRASLRSRFTLPGSLSQVVADVNCLLCLDTCKTNSFMTLFFMLIDSEKRKMQWVRAGHDPAFVYNPHTDSFDELRGEGMALGVDASFAFQEYEYSSWADEQIILIGTDGIWETENSNGEIFGKDRLQEIIRRNRHCSSQQIMQAVIDALGSFRQTTPQRDDVTLVVVKVVSMGCG